MKQLVEFELEDGSWVLIEIEDQGEASGRQRVSRGEGGIDRAETRFMDTLARVKPAAEAVLQSFRDLNTPDEISLEFGIKFGAKAGAFLASVDSEATFKVSLKWTNKD